MEVTICTSNELLSSTSSSSFSKPFSGGSTSTSPTSSNAMKVLPADYELNEYDVFCGRGSRCWNHVGNKRFRQRVDDEIVNYSQAKTKYCKTAIICKIIDEVRQLSPNGGFLRQDCHSGRYIEVGDFLAREKTSQAFRDALQGTYKSSNARKRMKRIESHTSMLQQNSNDSNTNLISLLRNDVLADRQRNDNQLLNSTIPNFYKCMESIINGSGSNPLNNGNGKMLGSVSLPAFQSMPGRIHHSDSHESFALATANNAVVPPMVFGSNKSFSVPDLNRIQMVSTNNASPTSSVFSSFNSEFLLDANGNMRSTPSSSSSSCLTGIGGADPATFPLFDLMNNQWDTSIKKFASTYMSKLSNNNCVSGGNGSSMQVDNPVVTKANTNMLMSSNAGINNSTTTATTTPNSDAETFRVLLEFSESIPKFETDDLEPTPLSPSNEI